MQNIHFFKYKILSGIFANRILVTLLNTEKKKILDVNSAKYSVTGFIKLNSFSCLYMIHSVLGYVCAIQLFSE